MTRFIFLLLLATGCKLPERGPSFLDGKGAHHTLADEKGHVSLFAFWATWCVPCQEELKNLAQLMPRLSGAGCNANVRALSVDDPSERGTALDRIAKAGPIPIGFDEDNTFSRRFAIEDIPRSIIFDAHVKPVWTHVGAASTDEMFTQISLACKAGATP